MSLIRWDPFGAVDETFNRMLPTMFGRWPSVTLDDQAGKFEWRPSADISETDKEYLIRAELPAVKKDDVKVTIDGGVVTIQGERKLELKDKSEKSHRIESFYGTFMRSFSLPDNADADAIRCDSKDGVLTVHVPKRQASKSTAKQIKVE